MPWPGPSITSRCIPLAWASTTFGSGHISFVISHPGIKIIVGATSTPGHKKKLHCSCISSKGISTLSIVYGASSITFSKLAMHLPCRYLFSSFVSKTGCCAAANFAEAL